MLIKLLIFLFKGDRDLGVAFQTHPGSPALFLGEAKYSAFLSSHDGYLLSALGSLSVSLPLGLALGSPIFPSGCEGKLGVALESLQGLRDLT